MPGTTAHGFRYPLDSDPVQDGAEATRNLANDVDDLVGAIAAGTVTVNVTASATGSAAVTFPAGRFANAPIIVVTSRNGSYVAATAAGITASGFTASVRHVDNTAATVAVQVTWIAIDQG